MQRPFVFSKPVFDALGVTESGNMLDVVEIASSCVVNATRRDATLLEAVPHT